MNARLEYTIKQATESLERMISIYLKSWEGGCAISALQAINGLRELVKELEGEQKEQCPIGWKMVPIEPTLDMYNAACKAFCAWEAKSYQEELDGKDFSQPIFSHYDTYRAMVEVVPSSAGKTLDIVIDAAPQEQS